jgi:S1-C subfamily serine protease
LAVLLFPAAVHAEDDIPLLRPEERQAVDQQADEFNQAVMPALTTAAKSTVRVWSGTRRLAYGTVVGDGSKILTKWSEVARSPENLRVEATGAGLRSVKLAGVYEDEDLALLEIQGSPLTPVKWSFEKPKLGSFMVASQPDGRPAAFGVVSVSERNLRDTDQSFLGVISVPGFQGPGVKIQEVAPDSGAAAAGLKAGSVILRVGERTISGLMELKNALTGVQPGAKISLLVDDGGGKKRVDVLLGNRPKLPQFSGDRLQQMERMGGPISEVRDSFTHAIQTDMRPKPNQIGGPVADLKGEVLGITMARADRTRSFVMPAAAVVELLKKPAGDPSVAQVRKPDDEAPLPTRGTAPQGRVMPGGEERMRRHLSDMQRLMDYMQEEMRGLEDPR